ncbi:MAG: peroxiredoxin family protein [Acidobacteriota bacterium]|nr:TlpA family protein disulfide reductase [Bryobacteraceae bacterium CoA2 C42]
MRSSLLMLVLATVLTAADPRPAPELVIKAANGQEQLLSKFRGKVVALEFLLTTCPHCQKASQTMQKLYKELGPQGFQPVGVAINDMANMLINDYTKQFNLTYPIGYANRDVATQFLQHPIMMSMLMPQVVIIDRKGVIRHQFPGGDKFFENEEKNMRDVVLPLLKAGAATPAPTAPKKPAAAAGAAKSAK